MKKMFLFFSLLVISNVAAICIENPPQVPRNTFDEVSLKNATTQPNFLFITIERTYADGSSSTTQLRTKELLPGESQKLSLVGEHSTANPIISSIVTTVGYKGYCDDFSTGWNYRGFNIAENKVLGWYFDEWTFGIPE